MKKNNIFRFLKHQHEFLKNLDQNFLNNFDQTLSKTQTIFSAK